jgi:hypothetical protein
VLNLYREQITAYKNAREAAKQELGEGSSEGEIVKELARAYTGHKATEVPDPVPELVDDHASNHGDPVVSYTILESMDNKRLRRMAADANGDISGRDTRTEWYSYFGRGADRDE